MSLYNWVSAPSVRCVSALFAAGSSIKELVFSLPGEQRDTSKAHVPAFC